MQSIPPEREKKSFGSGWSGMVWKTSENKKTRPGVFLLSIVLFKRNALIGMGFGPYQEVGFTSVETME